MCGTWMHTTCWCRIMWSRRCGTYHKFYSKRSLASIVNNFCLKLFSERYSFGISSRASNRFFYFEFLCFDHSICNLNLFNDIFGSHFAIFDGFIFYVWRKFLLFLVWWELQIFKNNLLTLFLFLKFI